MREVALKVEGLGKKFTLGQQRSVDLRRAVGQAARRFFSNGTSAGHEFWALKDLNLEIRQGEVVGIIGRNGAGKSTLLKILSRITYPTTGRFEINGRVSSLLEVGTGFHFELTGRENIFLNGTILGMRRSEIRKKFDEIVAFSGIENFIDTSVKHYSSGMRVRLAFSVAAHLEPEILIIDEVLAVGDAEFQKKCLGKMDEVSRKEGRTVLFVSHNMGAVLTLCSRGIVMHGGKIIHDSESSAAIQAYTESIVEANQAIETSADRQGSQDIIFSDLYITNSKGEKIDHVLAGTDMNVVIKLRAMKPVMKVDIGLSLHDSYDSVNSVLYSGFQNRYFDFTKGLHLVVLSINNVFLAQGRWSLRGLIKVNGELSDWPKFPLARFSVDVGDFYGTGHAGDRFNDTKFLVKGEWTECHDRSN
jgi:lipopolysaccharide transport system ATP-binding protein